MAPQIREILGLITFIAIVWDTIMTAVLLSFALRNRNRIDKLEQRASDESARQKRVQVQDIATLIQAVSALATAVLTTYTLLNLIKKDRKDAKHKLDNGVRNNSDDSSGDGSSDSVGKSTS